MSGHVEAGVVVRSSLAPAGPLERLDRAFVLVRQGGAELALRAWLGAGLPALAMLAYFYAERVEGIGALRLPAALAIVVSFLVRGWALANVSRAYVKALSERAPISPDAGGFLSVARTAVVVGLGLWVWSWGLLVAAGGGPIGIALFLPLLAFRGLVAPSWPARAGCASDAGLRAFGLAAKDTTHQRLESLLVESMLLLALFGLAANLYGIFTLVVLLGRSFLGLEMALVDEFLSFRNTFVLLGVTVVSAVALDPLRAALAAQVYVDARVRAEGLDLRAALDEAIAHTTRKPSRDTAATKLASARGGADEVAGVIVCVALGLSAASAHAQAPLSNHERELTEESGFADVLPPSPADAAALAEAVAETEASAEAAAQDARVREQARAILADGIFEDVEARRREGLADLIGRLFEWIIEQFADQEIDPGSGGPALPSLPLPGPAFFIVMGVLFAIVVAIFLVLTRRRDDASVATQAVTKDAIPDPRDRSPDDWLGDAASLAAQQRWGEALRALYLATLVALDRRAWIRFEPSLTNWQYLRQMPSGLTREDFRTLTRTFDVKVYGEEPAAESDYRASRAIAERILHASRPSLPPPAPIVPRTSSDTPPSTDVGGDA